MLCDAELLGEAVSFDTGGTVLLAGACCPLERRPAASLTVDADVSGDESARECPVVVWRIDPSSAEPTPSPIVPHHEGTVWQTESCSKPCLSGVFDRFHCPYLVGGFGKRT